MPTEEAPQSFVPNFNSAMPFDIGEDGGPSGSFMNPFDHRSPGFSERMMDPTFRRDLERFRSGSFGPPLPSGPTIAPPPLSPGRFGGPDTGIAKLAALSKPGALAPPVIPAGAAGVKTSGMSLGPSRVPGGLLGGLGIGPDY